jgi:hypothetical protein
MFSNTDFPPFLRSEALADTLAKVLGAQLFCFLLKFFGNHNPRQQVVGL